MASSFSSLMSLIMISLLFGFFAHGQKGMTSQQIESHLDECYSYLINSDFEAALPCLESKESAIEKSNYYAGIARYYTILTEYYMINGQIEESLQLIATTLKKYEKKFSEEDKIRFQILELQILENNKDYREVFSKIKTLLPQTTFPRHKAALHSIRALAYMKSAQYEEVVKDLYAALRIFEVEKDTSNIITIYNRIGLLHNDLKENEKALVAFQLAYDFAIQSNNLESLNAVYTNLGGVYKHLNMLDQAIENYSKATTLAKRTNNKMNEARNLLNLGDVYLDQGDITAAFKNFNESLQISKEANIPLGILYNYRSLGKAYAKIKDFENAGKSYDSAYRYANHLDMPNLKSDILFGFYEMYKEKGDYKKALEFFIKTDSIKQIIFSEDTKKSIADIETKYQTELKDQELEKIQIAFDKKKAQQKTLLTGSASVVALVGFLLFFVSYRHRTLKKLYERNMELLQTVNYYKVTPDEVDEKDQLKKVFDNLIEVLINEKIFKNPQLSLKDVTQSVRTNEKYLSAAISTYAKMNYSNFINFYRINEAKNLLGRRDFANLNEVMIACGFNSRTTFYNAFKKFTGLSPSQFRDMKKTQKAEV